MPPKINPDTDLVFHPGKNLWTVDLPEGGTQAFPGGWTGRVAATQFIRDYNAASAATA